jgi:hypothetical protein
MYLAFYSEKADKNLSKYKKSTSQIGL